VSRNPSSLGLNQTPSHISLQYNQSTFSGNSGLPSMTGFAPPDVMRAYEEEKAKRIGLQQYQNEVLEENIRLKLQNQDLQEKM
jgi:hypothetical protein